MKGRVSKFAVVVVALALLGVTGCSTMRALGFESRSARYARQLREEQARMAAQNAALEAQLLASQNERDLLASEYEEKLRLAMENAKAEEPTNWDDQFALLMERLGPGVTEIRSENGVKAVRMTSDILFRSGKADVRSEANSTLQVLAKAISNIDGDVVVFIDGHTDSDPLRYTKRKYRDNYGLGIARAESVAKKLIAMGVPRSRLMTRSFGQDRPIADNKTAAGKKQNRRVEISFAFGEAADVMKTAPAPTVSAEL